MKGEPRRRDWQVLGLKPGADPGQVRRAFLERKALYSQDSMATYTLLDEQERAVQLERIEEAYQRIMGAPGPRARPTPEREELPEAPSGPPPPADEAPGLHLRHHRLRNSLLLSEVADEIKVRAALLERIENEEFTSLPASVYVRGFVLQYARHLGLSEPDALAAAYLAKMATAKAGD